MAVAQLGGLDLKSAGATPSDITMIFGRVPREDRDRLSATELATLTAAALEHIAHRGNTQSSIRIVDPDIADVTVIEIINDNAPFLLDSTLGELTERGLEVRLVAHPIIAVERRSDGALVKILGEATSAGHASETRESFIHIHVARIASEAEKESLAAALGLIYADVRHAVADWQAMRSRLSGAIATYRQNPPPLAAHELAEAVQLLEWLLADNFTFLGMRDYRFPDGEVAADPRDGTGLGVLRDPSVKILRRGRDLVVMSPEIRRFLTEPVALIITKANVKSRVHRRTHLDYVGVKLFSDDGQLEGELRIVGLFTSTAYTSTTRAIPYIRHKIARILERTELDPNSHSGKALLNVLEDYPRDELFQVDLDTLYPFAMDILSLAERPRIRVLARLDQFDRFVSVLVYIPKDRYDTAVRRKVGAYLCGVFEGRLSAAYPYYPEGPLVRTHFIVGRDEGVTPVVSRETLETAVSNIIRTWADDLKDTLATTADQATAARLHGQYADAFTGAYREAFGAKEAIADIRIIESLTDARSKAVDFYRKAGDLPHRAALKVYSRGNPMPLSQRVPQLEHMGFNVVNERTYRVAPPGADEASTTWLHDMTLERASGSAIDIETVDPNVEALLMALFRGDADSDGYNALVVEAGLGWREVATLRAFSRYARQIRVSYSHEYMAATLVKHATLAGRIIALFAVRFDPNGPADMATRVEGQKTIRAEIERALMDVSVLDEDRILRRFVNLTESAVRTNFYQVGRDGQPRTVIAFKFECRAVNTMPLPRPLYEIFLSSPRVEGLHMRFGKVARGGIRWSDRPEDFRTEVLGLVKAQQVKNAVIVPVGAKGGFIPKRLPPASDRQAWLTEGTEAYRIFIRTLLELTDNLDGDTLVPAQNTVRHDGDDPYLVVAADKGTATFSDTANAISEERHHWLGDAFASGGSVGYDHKKMGITARGAWEAVKRHFREMDLDIQTAPFTVAGVGDMSGDVFGNGMLLSRTTRLVAAFDHRDIFLDPDPDAAKSFDERARLFALPRSSWQEYDKSLLSAGGGIFPRGSKSVPLSPQIQALLGIDAPSATPQEVMVAILKLKVDLLWFGGIGTYLRASDETDADAGDRANDPIRITGADLNARVVGEGANLGMTQRARIEAARRGIRLNTDAIDNSAGVNSSDVEVNIKIALAIPVRDGRLTYDTRNTLLVEMTDDVGRLVLRNNYLQSLALSLSQRHGAGDIGYLRRLMQTLESEGRLDRKVEFLPEDAAIAARERAGEGLTRPELAVLLAYAKLTLYDDLLQTTALDEPYFMREAERYFPDAIRQRFPDAITNHRLRREIIATGLTNSIINRGGPAVARRVMDRTGCTVAALPRAYAAVRDGFGLLDINTALDALDNKLQGARQLDFYATLQDVLVSRLVWFVRHLSPDADLQSTISHYSRGIEQVERRFAGEALPVAEELARLGMDRKLARRLALITRLADAPEIVHIADSTAQPLETVADIYFGLDEALALQALVGAAAAVKTADYYDQLALERAIDGVEAAQAALTREILAHEGSLEPWQTRRADEITRTKAAIADLGTAGLTVSKLTVAAGLLGDLVRR